MPLLVGPALPAGTLRDLDQPHLTVDELTLRPWLPTDAPMVQTAFSCPDIQRWHVRRLDSPEEAEEWTAQWKLRWTDETAASWAIVVNDEPLGQVGLREISLGGGSADVSYWVTPTARGRALAQRSVDAMSHWAFDAVGLHRLNLHHSTANEASCRVAATTGFALEGTLRKAILHADGWHDWHVHGRLTSDS